MDRTRLLRVAVCTWAVLMLQASNAAALTSWWSWGEPELLMPADSAITPGDMSGRSPDKYEPDDSLSGAVPLPIGGVPLDRVVAPGDRDHFVLQASDGPGYIRVGATGPLTIEDGTGDDATNAGVSEHSGPGDKADLLELSEWSPTELAQGRGDATAFLRITTPSRTPVAYRISFVSELPEDRVGGAYGPGVLAEDYVMAIARCCHRCYHQSGDQDSIHSTPLTGHFALRETFPACPEQAPQPDAPQPGAQ